MAFISGDKLGCIDAKGTRGFIKEGEVYTFDRYEGSCYNPTTGDPVVGLRLVEFPGENSVYLASRFRKVVKDLDNKEVTEDFRKLLKEKV